MELEDIFAESNLIGRKFNIKHTDVNKVIRRVLIKLHEFRDINCDPKIDTIDKIYRGTTYKAYRLNKDAFCIVMMRFENELARQWQSRYMSTFNLMDELMCGLNGEAQENNVLNDFIDYAISQGCTSIEKHKQDNHATYIRYGVLNIMVEKMPVLKAVIEDYQLSEMLLAEKVARESVEKYMLLGRNYNDIFTSVKQDLQTFGAGISITERLVEGVE